MINIKKSWKINLINLNPTSIKKIILLLNEKPFYYQMILLHIYNKNNANLNLIKNINNTSRFKLQNISYIKYLYIKETLLSKDNTIKLILTNNHYIESVLIPNNKNHFTLCLSSQINCILNCSFCYTGKMKFKGNLKHWEILSQILIAKKIITKFIHKKIITNVVFMGMGEPLLNFLNLLASIKTINNKYCMNIHVNKITVSSAGITPNVIQLNNLNIRLALSLHATTNNLRTKIMTINKKYSLTELLHTCTMFKKNNLTIEYIMLNNINDSKVDAENLSQLLKYIQCKVCLIPFNDFKKNNYKYSCSKSNNIKLFQKILKNNNIITTIRKSMGFDINGGCGQLCGKYD